MTCVQTWWPASDVPAEVFSCIKTIVEAVAPYIGSSIHCCLLLLEVKKLFLHFLKGDTETSTSILKYYAAFLSLSWGTMKLRISCKALEDICLSVIISMYCSACP